MNESSAPPPGRGAARRRQIADAALAVLAAEGARGLTHRAVDRAAALPEGSTSNAYRSREALLEAALARHVELDLAGAADPGDVRLTREQARAGIVAALRHALGAGDRALLVARYELFLESTRRPALKAELSRARERFVVTAERTLAATGCASPEVHGAQLVAVLDGLLLDQLLAAESALDDAAIAELVDRLLASC